MKRLLLAGIVMVLSVALAGCIGAGDGRFFADPGLVGIADGAAGTAPLLKVNYTVPPSTTVITANILSDQASDGDIAYYPSLDLYDVTQGPSVVFFGEDSLDIAYPEYRAFLTFPLDGYGGRDIVPSDAAIIDATLDVFVDRVSFASVVPTFLDLVRYPFRGLTEWDYDTIPLIYRTLNFYSSDYNVFIDVTPLMQEAQNTPGLVDFQVRFLVDARGTLSRSPSTVTGRTAGSQPRALDNLPSNRGPSASQPVAPPDPGSRKR